MFQLKQWQEKSNDGDVSPHDVHTMSHDDDDDDDDDDEF